MNILRWWGVLTVFLIGYYPTLSQVHPFSGWVTDGYVHDIETKGDTCFIAGQFTTIGIRTGSGFFLDPSTFTKVEGFPEVNGAILSAAPDGIGGIYIVGHFSMVDGQPRNNFAHIDQNGQLSDIRIEVNHDIKSVAVYKDHIYIAGTFSEVNGIEKNLIAELDLKTGKPTDFDFLIPENNLNGEVNFITVHQDKLFLGGKFNSVLNQSRTSVACINLQTHTLTTWNPELSESTNSLRVSKIIVHNNTVFFSGHFYKVKGQERMNIAQVDLIQGKPTNFSINQGGGYGIDCFTVNEKLLFLKNLVVDIDNSQTIREWKLPQSLDQISLMEVYENQLLVGSSNLYAIDLSSYQVVEKQSFTLSPVLGMISEGIEVLIPWKNLLFVGGQISGINSQKRNGFTAFSLTNQNILSYSFLIESLSSRKEKLINDLLIQDSIVYFCGTFDNLIIDSIYHKIRDIGKFNLNTGKLEEWNLKLAGEYVFGDNVPRIPNIFVRDEQVLAYGTYSVILEDINNSVPYIRSSGFTTFHNQTSEIVNNDFPILGKQVSKVLARGDTLFILGRRLLSDIEPYITVAILSFSERKLLSSHFEIPSNFLSNGKATTAVLTQDALYFVAGDKTHYLFKLDLQDMSYHRLPVFFDKPVIDMVLTDSLLYLAGDFSKVNFAPRKHLAAINLKTLQVLPWNPNFPAQELTIKRMKMWRDKLAVMGSFSHLGNQYSPNIALLDATAGEYVQLSGKAYWDMNKNCQFDQSEKPMSDVIIRVVPGDYYATIDSLGNYLLAVHPGTYHVPIVEPQVKGVSIEPVCPESSGYYTVDATSEKSIKGLDFAYTRSTTPYLSVDIVIDRRRRCFTSNTIVTYRNQGAEKATSAFIKVKYPAHVLPIASKPAWSEKTDQELIYNLGDLHPDQMGTISILDSVVCGDESIRGMTQCTEVTIFPPNQPVTDPRWDGSDIDMKARCSENSFVRLMLKNTGEGDMVDSAAYRIYLNASLVYQGQYKLLQQDSLELNIPTQGKTLHFEADFTAYHPTRKSASLVLEGCGINDSVTVSKGFVNAFPLDDEEATHEVMCLEISDSFDPNDKQVAPTGIEEERFTAEDALLEYTIRFQNTGTDTAFNIVVADTLDDHLDLSTLQMGVASHPFTWEITGEGKPILIWRFAHINLPDSNRNEPSSHGFVKFKVAFKNNLEKGTVVRNRASIYFDYNSPIITNTVFNTVGLPSRNESNQIVVQNCSYEALIGENTETIIYVCGMDSTLLVATNTNIGWGYWIVTKGGGIIEDIYDPVTKVRNLSEEVNEFVWQVMHCDDEIQHTVKVYVEKKLPEPPQVEQYWSYCEEDNLLPINAEGENVKWYQDINLQQRIYEGPTYTPVNFTTDTLYVTQQLGYCESQALPVFVDIVPRPEPPVVSEQLYCDRQSTYNFLAEGEHVQWYQDSLKQQLIDSGNFLSLPRLSKQGSEIIIYATQSMNGCESNVELVEATFEQLKTEEIFIPNIITPNGDLFNDSFHLPTLSQEENDCIGGFVEVQIFNRWGNKIYSSKSAQFQWIPKEKVASGLYFYTLQFENVQLNGQITVLR